MRKLNTISVVIPATTDISAKSLKVVKSIAAPVDRRSAGSRIPVSAAIASGTAMASNWAIAEMPSQTRILRPLKWLATNAEDDEDDHDAGE